MKYQLPSVAIVLSSCVSLMIASGSCSAQQPEQTSSQTYEQPGVIDRLPAFHSNLSARLTHRLSWLSGDFQDYEQWRNSARRKVLDCLLEPPPVVAFDPVVIDSEDRGTYVAHKVVLNLTGDSRVLSLMLVPKASGPHPAVLLLHDHGAKFDIGKEKVIRSWGIDSAKLQSSEDWVDRYYGGRFIGDELASQGFVCFATDMLNWSDRGGGGFENQQALAANLLQYGVSWSGLIAHEDLRAAEFLASRAEVDPQRITAMGLSVGGYRTWQVAALSPHISQGVSVCWMATQRGLLVPGNNQTTGQSAFTMVHPGLARELDYPDVASIACPKRMMFLCGNRDALFPKASTEAAFETMRKVWQSQHADDALVTTLYDAPHEFNEQMQDDAFRWLLKTQQ